jgi:hypothetical protein
MVDHYISECNHLACPLWCSGMKEERTMSCCACPDLEYENHNGACTVFCINCHRVYPDTLTEAQAREVNASAIDDYETSERED